MGNKKTVQKKVKPYEIGELDQYLFGQGTHYEIYKKLGAHKVTVRGKDGVYFAVWAPNARRVSVVGDFNEWDFEENYMERQDPEGIYTCFIPGVQDGDLYKFCIETMQENGFSRQIHLQIMQSCAPEQLPGLPIFHICHGQTGNGWKPGRNGAVRRILWQYTRCTWDPG